MKQLKTLVVLLCMVYSANADIVKHTENTKKDTKTNIVWQDTKDVTSTRRSYEDAKSYCANLKLDGINSWKVPGFLELFSIVDTKAYNPTISKTFEHIVSKNYWTTKTFGHGTSQEAFVVNFLSGAFNREKMDQKFFVRCYSK